MADEPPEDEAEAFDWLDAYFAIPEEETSPDEAFDWIYMMHGRDWELLEEAWGTRPDRWRESCAYILGEGPVPESIPLLTTALFDKSEAVTVQAACSYAQQRLYHGAVVPLDDRIVERLRAAVEKAGGKNVEEVVEVLQRVRP
jgi:hypothetical protein